MRTVTMPPAAGMPTAISTALMSEYHDLLSAHLTSTTTGAPAWHA